MANNLAGIRKEYWNTGSFRMILKEALEHRPIHPPFDSKKDQPVDVQIEQWKAMSAQCEGFDMAFKLITGHSPGEFNNE